MGWRASASTLRCRFLSLLTLIDLLFPGTLGIALFHTALVADCFFMMADVQLKLSFSIDSVEDSVITALNLQKVL